MWQGKEAQAIADQIKLVRDQIHQMLLKPSKDLADQDLDLASLGLSDIKVYLCAFLPIIPIVVKNNNKNLDVVDETT